MKRNWFLCLLVFITIVLSLGDTLKEVQGLASQKEAEIVVQPGDAAATGHINQAEARQLARGRLAVPAIGTGALPDEKALPIWKAPEPIMPPVVQGRVLILYDAVAGHPAEKFGLAYAIMLSNLLGHFSATVNLLPIDRYTSGAVELYQATFYLGSHYDNPVPAAFMQDVRHTNRTVVWFKNNLWQFAWNGSYDFANRYGFSFVRLRGFDTPPAPGQPQPGFFDTVNYKGLPFVKYYSYDAARNVAFADPDLGIVSITDPAKAKAWLTVTNSTTNEITPYVTRSGQFWYVADIPFSFIGPRDRYVIFCDLLHELMRQPHKENHRALIRLEDVSAKVEPASFRQLANTLAKHEIPFSVALIPSYRDAYGAHNNGTPEVIEFEQAANLISAAKYTLARGGSLLLHGHTHQYNSLRNPSGATGTDWEFWDAVNNKTIPGDSLMLMGRRIDMAFNIMRSHGFTPFAWETPHYQGSPNTYRAAQRRFPVKYERGTYYTSEHPNLLGGDYAVPQFFPYLIRQDFYGQRVIPENLGNVIYGTGAAPQSMRGKPVFAACGMDTSFSQAESLRLGRNVRLSQVGNHFALYENARYALVVRDGFASFFFHPFLVRSDSGVPALADLQTLTEGITKLGYQWTAASSLVEKN